MAIFTFKGCEILIDDEDKHLLKKGTWSLASLGRTTYARCYLDGRRFLLHREIMGATKGQEVDHINGNALDNRRQNLRLCTHQENMVNRPMFKNNKSGRKGVHWDKEKRKWRAAITSKGKIMHLGYFTDLEDASKAYETAAVETHGAFRRE